MTQEWKARFIARLVEAGGMTKHEAATTAIDFDGTDTDYNTPESTADKLIAVWDDEGEPA